MREESHGFASLVPAIVRGCRHYCGFSGFTRAWAANAPGVTDAEIKIGQTFPYSGPASGYGAIARAEAAYFKMINEKGGVNGRKLNLISLDDGYSAPKTVEQTRRLIEEEGVAFIFQTFGGFTNLAIRPYLNDNKVPQLFGAAGADQLDDPQHFPWTVGFNPATSTEGRIYAKHILATKPDAKIGVLYQNDQLGKTFLAGVRDALGDEHAGMLVKEVSYEVAEPTVDSQVVTLQGAGVDALIIAATSKAAAQAIRKVYDIGWTPERYLFFGAASIAGTLKPAGLEKSKGLITAGYLKDPTVPTWQDDPGLQGMGGFRHEIHEPDRRSRGVRGLRVHGRRNDGSCSRAMRRRSVAREYSAPGARDQGPRAADAARRGSRSTLRPTIIS